MQAAQTSLGLKVPQEMSFLGFDDTEACMGALPPLTSFRQPREEMGRKAMETLLVRIEKGYGKGACVHLLLGAELVERRSVATIPAKERAAAGGRG